MAEAPKTAKLYFDGVLKECTLEEDRNGSILYVSEDGRFVKFGTDVSKLEELVKRHNEVNKEEVELVHDVTYGAVEITPPTEPTN